MYIEDYVNFRQNILWHILKRRSEDIQGIFVDLYEGEISYICKC